MRTYPRQRGLGGLLHHVPELPRDRQAALARIRGRLEEQHVAADGSERQPGRDAGIGCALAHLALEASRPEPPAHAALVDPERLRARLAFCDLTRRLAQDVGEPPLEIAHPRLPRVLAKGK